MLARSVHPAGCREFEAEILVLHHPTTISPNYQAVGQYTESITSYSMSDVVVFD